MLAELSGVGRVDQRAMVGRLTRGSSFNGVVVRKDADDVGAPLDLAIEALDGVRAVKLGPMLLWEGHVGEHVRLGGVEDGCQLGNLWTDLVRDGAPTALARETVINSVSVAF